MNFSLFSEHAEGVELCLFSADEGQNHQQETRVPMSREEGFIWRTYVRDLGPGQHYGYRVNGVYDPCRGERFNRSKLLIDPYAKALTGDFDGHPSGFGYDSNIAGPDADLVCSAVDSAARVPKSIVISDSFSWDGDQPIIHPWSETILYETHVKGMTMLNPDIPQALRGTYAGIGHPATVEHLCKLGITSIELLPVFQYVSKPGHLQGTSLTNYWGYDPINFFSPHASYCSTSTSSGQQVFEFKQMVKNLHAAGIEVILDVVYNHTAEADRLGPTLCFRGIDNLVYYRLVEGDPRSYLGEYTGCGNCLNTNHPLVLKLIMDSLRYWVQEMHIDGFRFDLVSALARSKPIEMRVWDRINGPRSAFIDRSFDPDSSFFTAIYQDPILSKVKLIAEPWDLSSGGYQLGSMPQYWREWNDKYRDTIRQFWSYGNLRPIEFSARVSGSPDIFTRRSAQSDTSINFITSHDGFTLEDLVSFNVKHNDANLEAAGWDLNHSNNCGVEGASSDPHVRAIRDRRKRSMLTLLFLSKGIPMLLGGDEIGRSQAGNNNAYCQDNEISWYNWQMDKEQLSFLEFSQELSKLRKSLHSFPPQSEHEDVLTEMLALPLTDRGEYILHEQEIGHSSVIMLAFCMLSSTGISGSPLPERISSEEVKLLLLMNGSSHDWLFLLPTVFAVDLWTLRMDTSHDQGYAMSNQNIASMTEITVPSYSAFVLQPHTQLS